jgi:hypothetical protein
MPTQIAPAEKAAFIALVEIAPFPGGPLEASRLQDVLVYYTDIPTAIGRQLELYASNNAYLKECMAVFDDTELQNANIYNNKYNSPVAPFNDAVMIINSTYDGIIGLTAHANGFTLLGHSYVSRLELDDGVILQNLYIGPGSTLDVLDSAGTLYAGAVLNIWLPFANNTASALNSAVFGSVIGAVHLTKGSFYGGLDQNDPQLPCAIPVTSLYTSGITHDSITLNWTPPASGYLFLDVFYKRTDSAPWLQPKPDMIGFITFSGEVYGFVFSGLEADTSYDFKVSVRCNNGGLANETMTASTVCCGASTVDDFIDCKFYITIKDTPGTTMQALCNGELIYTEYPSGTTLQIPYLAGKDIVADLIIDNNNTQEVSETYDKPQGKWDAAGTPIAQFVDGNKITIVARIPN